MLKWFRRKRVLSIQAKISAILLGVILPTSLIVNVISNQLTRPVVEDELRQVGVNVAKTMAAEIATQRMHLQGNAVELIEKYIQEFLYTQPSVIRADVILQDGPNHPPKVVASNIDEESAVTLLKSHWTDVPISIKEFDEELKVDVWRITVPIENHRLEVSRGAKKILGIVHIEVSLRVLDHVVGRLWKVSAVASVVSVVFLIGILSFLLRRAIHNERLLRKVEDRNVALSRELLETQRQLMNTEKLAVMGQLTASFAHEIGTPLNAVGGHVQLLRDEIVNPTTEMNERIGIIQSQLSKIEQVVKNFLHSTGRPASQRQLVDVHQILDQTMGLVDPRVRVLEIEVSLDFDRSLSPIRVVPVDLEQIFLNLVDNSIDSIKEKIERGFLRRSQLKIQTKLVENSGLGHQVQIRFYDTGRGIAKKDLERVLVPFYTTKERGEGTGLGLPICQELVKKYGGTLTIESKEGQWTEVLVTLPCGTTEKNLNEKSLNEKSLNG